MSSQLPPSDGQRTQPPSTVRPIILLVEDDFPTRQVFREALSDDGFEIIAAATGREALAHLATQPIDLVMADVMMPDLDGFELCRQIRRDPRLGHIPVILVSGNTAVSDRVAGIEVGADDYLTKPIDIDELSARLTMHLRRSSREQQLNPLTRLPGNLAIEQALQTRLASGEAFALAYGDLDDFKAYNDRYGFHAGDGVLRFTGRLIATVVGPYRSEGAFVGHIGGDDFIIVSGIEAIEPICQEIISRFDREIPAYYTPEDRARGYIVSKDRTGREHMFPFVSISLGVVLCQPGTFSHFAELSQIATEVKNYAKQQPGSAYQIDRRTHGQARDQGSGIKDQAARSGE